MNFEALKNRAKGGVSDLAKKLEAMNGSSRENDTRIYKAGFDKTKGSGYAIVRFLPNPHTDNQDFVRRYFYGFKGKNGWYNETSRKTISQQEKDPVAYSNALYYKLEQETGAKRPAGRNRREEFYANVYVIKDNVTPEFEGKVMIMKFGAQIFKKLQSKITPEFEDDVALDPFCVFNGADFKIKISANEIPDSRDSTKKVTVPSYENSEFANPSEFMGGDKDSILEIVNGCYNLDEFAVCKSFDDLAQRFSVVTGEPYDKLEVSNPINEMASSAMKQFEDAKATNNTSIENDEDNHNQINTQVSDDDNHNQINTQVSDDDDDILARFKSLAAM